MLLFVYYNLIVRFTCPVCDVLLHIIMPSHVVHYTRPVAQLCKTSQHNIQLVKEGRQADTCRFASCYCFYSAVHTTPPSLVDWLAVVITDAALFFSISPSSASSICVVLVAEVTLSDSLRSTLVVVLCYVAQQFTSAPSPYFSPMSGGMIFVLYGLTFIIYFLCASCAAYSMRTKI